MGKNNKNKVLPGFEPTRLHVHHEYSQSTDYIVTSEMLAALWTQSSTLIIGVGDVTKRHWVEDVCALARAGEQKQQK